MIMMKKTVNLIMNHVEHSNMQRPLRAIGLILILFSAFMLSGCRREQLKTLGYL